MTTLSWHASAKSLRRNSPRISGRRKLHRGCRLNRKPSQREAPLTASYQLIAGGTYGFIATLHPVPQRKSFLSQVARPVAGSGNEAAQEYRRSCCIATQASIGRRSTRGLCLHPERGRSEGFQDGEESPNVGAVCARQRHAADLQLHVRAQHEGALNSLHCNPGWIGRTVAARQPAH